MPQPEGEVAKLQPRTRSARGGDFGAETEGVGMKLQVLPTLQGILQAVLQVGVLVVVINRLVFPFLQ